MCAGFGYELPKDTTFSYQAGQFVYLVLANGDERPYSIASAPNNNLLEFHIHYHSGDNAFTHALFNELLANKSIRLHGPKGNCIYHLPAAKHWALLAGGTGLAPCKAIIEAAIQHQHTKPIHLYWGARTTEHLYFHQELLAWQQQHPWFTYTPVLFEQQHAGPDYQYGMVHEIVCRDYPHLAEVDVYASGPAIMVFAAQEYLRRHGLPDGQFSSDYT